MDIIISNTSDKPIYEQIVLQIKEMIINGKLAEAELMPSIRNLAKELQISVITTKRAYDELEKDGYLVTIPGKGTYVAAQNKELLQESRLRLVEEKLLEAAAAGKSIGLSLEEMQEMLKILYEEA
ncbi:MAG: GntR family transcriptional regulator [Dethiobacteria bacterium]|nr:GntR family transcriptional regulator [Bacillota bacterium]HOP69186.1 GntR family transcriptional regulator [Bacillota bacterium]HPT34614.1 GntR family transcriptional regulator [Bacillota bacterium]HPZ64972.1 GntR family transcriptional regulator [Bacillota bacterium]HQD06595.1 GntR family transcriptional regulator [Bacillota bacterium]